MAPEVTKVPHKATKTRRHEVWPPCAPWCSSYLRAFVAVPVIALVAAAAPLVSAQGPLVPAPAVAIPVGPAVVDDYVIGPDDVLVVQFWREKDLSAEVTVRPDGKVSLPLLNDIRAAGLTPEQLRDAVLETARKYVEDPIATVIVKQINSRKVFITGQVEKPGPYPLAGRMTVLQLIATAGGLKDWVDGKNILVMRNEGGLQAMYRFNYQDVVRHRNLRQNIELKSGDTVLVP